MCMQDVIIGRNARSTQFHRVMGLASLGLLEADGNRFSIIISAPQLGRMTLSFATTAVDLQGIVLKTGDAPLILSLKEHGDIVTRAIQAICDNAAQTIGVWTTSFN